MAEKKLNLFQKLAGITSEVGVVLKNKRVGEGRNSYKAAVEGDILDAVKPLEEKYGIYSYASARKVLQEQRFEKKTEYNGQTTVSYQNFIRIETTYRFVDTDDPDRYIEITSYGDGLDSGDKAPGKAQTYSDKYAIMKAYKIITGDDPDQYGGVVAPQAAATRQTTAAKAAKDARKPAKGEDAATQPTVAQAGKKQEEKAVENSPAVSPDAKITKKEAECLRKQLEKEGIPEDVFNRFASISGIGELNEKQFGSLCSQWSAKVVPVLKKMSQQSPEGETPKGAAPAGGELPREDIA